MKKLWERRKKKCWREIWTNLERRQRGECFEKLWEREGNINKLWESGKYEEIMWDGNRKKLCKRRKKGRVWEIWRSYEIEGRSYERERRRKALRKYKEIMREGRRKYEKIKKEGRRWSV